MCSKLWSNKWVVIRSYKWAVIRSLFFASSAFEALYGKIVTFSCCNGVFIRSKNYHPLYHLRRHIGQWRIENMYKLTIRVLYYFQYSIFFRLSACPRDQAARNGHVTFRILLILPFRLCSHSNRQCLSQFVLHLMVSFSRLIHIFLFICGGKPIVDKNLWEVDWKISFVLPITWI